MMSDDIDVDSCSKSILEKNHKMLIQIQEHPVRIRYTTDYKLFTLEILEKMSIDVSRCLWSIMTIIRSKNKCHMGLT